MAIIEDAIKNAAILERPFGTMIIPPITPKYPLGMPVITHPKFVPIANVNKPPKNQPITIPIPIPKGKAPHLNTFINFPLFIRIASILLGS